MGILSGLEKMGFKSFDKVDLFEEEKKEAREKKVKKKKVEKKEPTERDLLYDKSMICPICQKEFKVKSVIASKARRDIPDIDMRPKYISIDPLKYDVIVCYNCGFAALSSYFKEELITDNQLKMIREGVVANYNPQPDKKYDLYTYDEAIDNHRLALLNAVVKKARASEKAYICLKLGWLYRGKLENYNKESENYESVAEECKAQELEYLEEAKKGFIFSLAHEGGKICGMDPVTIEYLCAALDYDLGNNEECLRLISKLITNPAASSQLKDKCRELKEAISEAD